MLPFAHPHMAGIRLVWLTDMAVPDRAALGLTSHTLTCDRLECRYLVAPCADILPWAAVRRAGLGKAMLQTAGAGALIAFEAGRQPDRWFVSLSSLTARLDRDFAFTAESQGGVSP